MTIRLRNRLWLLPLLMLFAASTAYAATDARMQVDVLAEKHEVEVRWLHANIRKAADMALPILWYRLVPQHSRELIPKKLKAIRFLQRATPTKEGVRITFNEKRVLKFLKENRIPYYAEQSARVVEPPAVAAGPGVAQPPSTSAKLQHLIPGVQQAAPLLLTVQRQASLPEQVLFEEDLRRDPRMLHLSLRQVNRDSQQYRVQLKGADDLWLKEWFRRRGLTLSPTVEGWVAR